VIVKVAVFFEELFPAASLTRKEIRNFPVVSFLLEVVFLMVTEFEELCFTLKATSPNFL
jgi:hypothetical protein